MRSRRKTAQARCMVGAPGDRLHCLSLWLPVCLSVCLYGFVCMSFSPSSLHFSFPSSLSSPSLPFYPPSFYSPSPLRPSLFFFSLSTPRSLFLSTYTAPFLLPSLSHSLSFPPFFSFSRPLSFTLPVSPSLLYSPSLSFPPSVSLIPSFLYSLPPLPLYLQARETHRQLSRDPSPPPFHPLYDFFTSCCQS